MSISKEVPQLWNENRRFKYSHGRFIFSCILIITKTGLLKKCVAIKDRNSKITLWDLRGSRGGEDVHCDILDCDAV
jgi:hypothetical protein